MATTWRAPVRFVVKEHHNGVPFVVIEQLSGDLGPVKKLLISFDLEDGIDLAAAKDLARLLESKIPRLAVTD